MSLIRRQHSPKSALSTLRGPLMPSCVQAHLHLSKISPPQCMLGCPESTCCQHGWQPPSDSKSHGAPHGTVRRRTPSRLPPSPQPSSLLLPSHPEGWGRPTLRFSVHWARKSQRCTRGCARVPVPCDKFWPSPRATSLPGVEPLTWHIPVPPRSHTWPHCSHTHHPLPGHLLTRLRGFLSCPLLKSKLPDLALRPWPSLIPSPHLGTQPWRCTTASPEAASVCAVGKEPQPGTQESPVSQESHHFPPCGPVAAKKLHTQLSKSEPTGAEPSSPPAWGSLCVGPRAWLARLSRPAVRLQQSRQDRGLLRPWCPDEVKRTSVLLWKLCGG